MFFNEIRSDGSEQMYNVIDFLYEIKVNQHRSNNKETGF